MKINIKEATKIGLYIEKLETKVRELEENNTDLACQLQANQMAGQNTQATVKIRKEDFQIGDKEVERVSKNS